MLKVIQIVYVFGVSMGDPFRHSYGWLRRNRIKNYKRMVLRALFIRSQTQTESCIIRNGLGNQWTRRIWAKHKDKWMKNQNKKSFFLINDDELLKWYHFT